MLDTWWFSLCETLHDALHLLIVIVVVFVLLPLLLVSHLSNYYCCGISGALKHDYTAKRTAKGLTLSRQHASVDIAQRFHDKVIYSTIAMP